MLFVYWLEENPQYTDRIHRIFLRMEERKDTLCTSAFSLGEVLAGPYERGAVELASRIRSALREPFVRVLPFTAEAADRYAQIRARLRVSPADAIHLACAAQAGVDVFLTNDHQLAGKIVPGIQFIANLDVGLF